MRVVAKFKNFSKIPSFVDFVRQSRHLSGYHTSNNLLFNSFITLMNNFINMKINLVNKFYYTREFIKQ